MNKLLEGIKKVLVGHGKTVMFLRSLTIGFFIGALLITTFLLPTPFAIEGNPFSLVRILHPLIVAPIGITSLLCLYWVENHIKYPVSSVFLFCFLLI